MAFLKVSKNYSDILVEHLILTSINTPLSSAVNGLRKHDLYLKDVEIAVETLSGFLAFVSVDLSLLNCHRLPEESD